MSSHPSYGTRDAKSVERVTDKLQDWILSRDATGYDPYDVKGHSLIKNCLNDSRSNVFCRVRRRVATEAIRRFPMSVRRLLFIRPRKNAKGIGLTVAALARRGGEHVQVAEKYARWLMDNYSNGYAGICWGYPFGWDSPIFFPAGTPSVVVSSVVGDGFWELFLETNKEEYLEVCRSICKFIKTDLRQSRTEHGVCLSYSPLDDYLVHNANLFGAEFLARIGNYDKSQEYVDLADRCVNYALSEVLEDGSLPYWGNAQNNGKHFRDCYHSGFEIRSLRALGQYLGRKDVRNAAERYFTFFCDSYLKEGGQVWLRPNKQYPADIHACAEAFLCPAAMLSGNNKKKVESQMWDTFGWVMNHFSNDDGSFGYRLGRDGAVDRMPYMRWGQAWMLRALVEFEHIIKAKT